MPDRACYPANTMAAADTPQVGTLSPEQMAAFLRNLDDQLSRVEVEVQIARTGIQAMQRHLGAA